MASERKHVDWLDFLDTETLFAKEAEVSGQRLRVTGNVDQALRCQFGAGRQESFGGAGPWRVHHNHVHWFTGLCHFGDEVRGITDVKRGILDLIAPCVVFGVFYSVFVQLYANDLLGPHGGGNQANGARSAVGIKEGFCSGQSGILYGCPVKNLRLHRINLVKAFCRNAERAPQQFIFNVALSV